MNCTINYNFIQKNRGKGDIMAPIYLFYNNFVNNQYLNLKLNDYTFVKVIQSSLDSKL